MQDRIQKVKDLRTQGYSRAKIVSMTGYPDRFVRAHMKDVEKTGKPLVSAFDKSVADVFPLCIRQQGCKEWEMREILHKHYGVVWNTSKGVYESSFNANTRQRVRDRCKELTEDGQVAVFIPDWVDIANPTASRVGIESLALSLQEYIDNSVEEFMNTFGAPFGSTERVKQAYAAREHILKVAIRGYSSEPVESLLENTRNATDTIEYGLCDLPVPKFDKGYESQSFHPEPTDDGVFLDFVESQGWVK